VSRGAAADPQFFGAYVEGGYFFTGETRGYRGGKFDRVKVLNGLDKGGFGSLGLSLRWDYLDLSDAGILGGTQHAYQAALNWKPTDYVLFGLNLAHIAYDDAAIALDDGDRSYGVNVAAVRSQIDF
ncbi:MAG: porin, partial [Pseudomonadota bacterium]|nr:porin [Pseudomonadota bacterium]